MIRRLDPRLWTVAYLLLALPFAWISTTLAQALGSLDDNRLWLLVLAVGSVVALAGLAWRAPGSIPTHLSGPWPWIFLYLYCLFFATLMAAEPRRPVNLGERGVTASGLEAASDEAGGNEGSGGEGVAPERAVSEWGPGQTLLPIFGRLSDLRYRLAPDAGRAVELLLVVLPDTEGRIRPMFRRELALLIGQAVDNGARGIALDFDLSASSAADFLFCNALLKARQAAMPFLLGYRHVRTQEILGRLLPHEDLTRCLGEEAGLTAGELGSLSAVADLDGRARAIPLYFRGDPELPTFSLQIARRLPGFKEPRRRLTHIRFLAPKGGVETFEGLPRGDDLEVLRDRFVVVGSDSEADSYETPLGALRGVEIQAYAAQSLRSSSYLRHLRPAWAFPLIAIPCFLLLLLVSRGARRRAILGAAGVLAIALILVALWLLRVPRIWMELATPLFATGLWCGLMMVGVRAWRRSTAPSPADSAEETSSTTTDGSPAMPVEIKKDEFAVFLSHNGKDKPVVRELTNALEERGIRCWLDERELIPGRAWQEELERALAEAKTVAVLVGPDGLGPWEEMEMRVCLMDFVKERKPAIPVLLPECPQRPKLPSFLGQLTWVDLRGGMTKSNLDRLEWGITGIKPEGFTGSP